MLAQLDPKERTVFLNRYFDRFADQELRRFIFGGVTNVLLTAVIFVAFAYHALVFAGLTLGLFGGVTAWVFYARKPKAPTNP